MSLPQPTHGSSHGGRPVRGDVLRAVLEELHASFTGQLGSRSRRSRSARPAGARVVGEDRLWLPTSCGFGRHSAREGDVEVRRAKMTNLARAAATF